MLGGWYAHSVLAGRVGVTMLIQRGYVGYAGVPLPVLSLAVCGV